MTFGRDGLRLAGMATAGWRPAPDFVILGTKRGGTTAFYFELMAHPQVVPLYPSPRWLPKRNYTKGVHYFDTQHDRGPRWYASHFPTKLSRRTTEHRHGGPVVAGEASPYYLFHPLAPQRAAAELPAATKFIALLRDPVERTHSQWRERRRNHAEPLGFAAALAAEPDRLRGEEERIRREPGYRSYAHEHQSYLTQSRYVHGLQRWYDAVGSERVLVLTSEDYYSEPAQQLKLACDFLGIPPVPHAGGVPLNETSQSPMPSEVREFLRTQLRSDTEALESLVGHSFGWESMRLEGPR